MTKIQIPVEQMTHTVGLFKIGHGHLQQILATLNSHLTPLLGGFEGETAERFAHLYRYAEKNLNTTLELLQSVSLQLEQIRDRFVETDSTMVNISSLLEYQANPGTARTNDLVCGPNDPPPKRSVEEHVDAFFNQAGENVAAIGDSVLQLGKDFIEHPLDTAGNLLYDNTVGTITDIGNGIAFTWNYAWDNGDTREQAEKQIAAEFDKMKVEGGAEYAANITTSMLLGVFGRKVGVKSIEGRQHHSPHTDSGGNSDKSKEHEREESNENSTFAIGTSAVHQAMLDKSPKYRNDLNYDCSEIAEDLANAAHGHGEIITLRSSEKYGRIEVYEYGVKEKFDYHTVYSDGKYVYDPRYSDDPVPKDVYLKDMGAQNEGNLNISIKNLDE
ncbi:WXG100 family type VII secretion target [Paenibacillus illinoisensis]|uniref:WXG100 family type VII secretion target n=1 Tax=Paenibacillus illinoisensis TaxID=59845 RepID=UPI001C8EDD8E|nr:WXG100 family type VII secretion target [Paenibacillus illinoisensis]MBY0217848.1 WXG100 family type VII secretion target [Paenibacillus illinoisensis]